MSHRLSVTSADFIRNIGYWQNEALRQPLAITHHGRERLVLAAPEAFEPRADAEAPLTAARAANARAEAAALLQYMEEGCLGFDHGLRLTSINPTAEAFIGRACDSVMGAPAAEILPDPLGLVLADRLQRVLRTRKAEQFEACAFDGRWLALRAFPTPLGATALFTNSTELHALRRQNEASAALHLALAGHVDLALVRLDANGRIEGAGGAFTPWTGFSADDVMGHRLADLVAGASRRELTSALESVLRHGEPRQLDLPVLAKRGEELQVRLAMAPIISDFVARGVQMLWTLRPHAASATAAA